MITYSFLTHEGVKQATAAEDYTQPPVGSIGWRVADDEESQWKSMQSYWKMCGSHITALGKC